ncbi:hypothetical protein FC87_GL000818 [Fructilactobacillus florum DSM 22689 = JCM 16035]|uniref:Metallo-beta-lactamase domain-containing protein n=1 Tax=Fructilactobacillus florum DSM 22689 = JCM 16035 TaxID=1423745 RepID=A0A0R2CJC1_9LACO|nr:Late competence protein ComEC, DNA transport [Fructilactobacillus florum 2F]KRM91681.1 hypothetical protein FC87_GL000818 [Fructilactobacillus florum DSM 22689 = JCM 16035]
MVTVPSLHQQLYLRGQATSRMLATLHTTKSLLVTGRLQPLAPIGNQNQFDGGTFQRQRGINGQLQVQQLRLIAKQPPATFFEKLHELRFWGLWQLRRFPHLVRLYAACLLFGYQTEDFRLDLNGVQQLGLIHLFTISGRHVYFLLQLATYLLTRLRLRRKWIDWFNCCWLPVYCVISGFGVGLWRACLGTELRIQARLLQVNLRGLDLWAVTLMLHLLINPWVLCQFGGQLAYLLSFTMLVTNTSRYWQQMLWMNLIGLPLILYHGYTWHCLSFLVSLWMVPIFGRLVFPLILVSYLLGVFRLPGLQISNWLLQQITVVINGISQFPGEIIFGKPQLVLVVLLLLVGLGAFFKQVWQRWITFFLLLLLSFGQIHLPTTGEITFFDVGQGDSILIRAPFNQTVTLIDTGGRLDFGNHRRQGQRYQAEQTSINYLHSIGIHRIDNLCLSHQDADHIGDLPAYLKTMQIKRIYFPWGMERNRSFMHRLVHLKQGTELIPARAGMKIAKTSLRVLHPHHPGFGHNEDSLVLWGKIAGLKWIFTGDLPRVEEVKLLQQYPKLQADVIKLGHHGSKTASDPSFLRRLAPRFGIISAGRANRYGHPNHQTLDTLQRLKIRSFSTQTQGMISFEYRAGQAGRFKTKWKGKSDDHQSTSSQNY